MKNTESKVIAISDNPRQNDLTGALADTNEIREIAPDNFYNEENVKTDQIKDETKKDHEKSEKLKKAKQRAIELNNKLFAKKQKNKLKNQNKITSSRNISPKPNKTSGANIAR